MKPVEGSSVETKLDPLNTLLNSEEFKKSVPIFRSLNIEIKTDGNKYVICEFGVVCGAIRFDFRNLLNMRSQLELGLITQSQMIVEDPSGTREYSWSSGEQPLWVQLMTSKTYEAIAKHLFEQELLRKKPIL